jgi:hypothetical protein
MTASKSKKDRHREDNDSILKIKQDNIEAARKQQSKNKNRSN